MSINGGLSSGYQRFTVRYFVHHRSQGSKVRVAHCILGWDPLFGFILIIQKKKHKKEKKMWRRIKTNYYDDFFLFLFLWGSYRKELVQKIESVAVQSRRSVDQGLRSAMVKAVGQEIFVAVNARPRLLGRCPCGKRPRKDHQKNVRQMQTSTSSRNRHMPCLTCSFLLTT